MYQRYVGDMSHESPSSHGLALPLNITECLLLKTENRWKTENELQSIHYSTLIPNTVSRLNVYESKLCA